MLWFMVATSHFYVVAGFADPGSGAIWTFIIIALVTAGAGVERPGSARWHRTGPLRWPYENHRNAIITGFVFWAVLWLLSELILG